MNGLPDEISLVNAALARFGGGVIASFDEETDLAATCVALYPTLVDAVLSRHDWKHLVKTSKLQRLADAPENGFLYAYLPPADAFTAPRRLLERLRPACVLRDYVMEGLAICCDAADVWGAYGRRLSPDQWTPALRLAMIPAIAADLCVAVCDDKDMAAMLRQEAFGPPQMQGRGGLFAQAIDADHAAAPGQPALLAGPSPLSGYSAYPVDWMRGR